jgi:hypothetical protein
MNDWIKAVAPLLGTAIAGPLGGVAASFIADKLGLEQKTVEAVTSAISAGTLTPEQLTNIKAAELDFKKYLEDNKIKLEDMVIKDIQDARKFNANTHGILYLGYGINALSYICIFAILYGCYLVIAGAKVGIDPGLAAMVGSVVGAVVQWLMSNAAQANAFFFGSSPSSRQTAQELSRSVGEAVTKIK